VPDPYATRAPDLSGRPSGPAPWLEPVRERGGAIISADGAVPADASFLVVDCRGIGTLAPFSRVDPALATLLWAEHRESEPTAPAIDALYAAVRDFARETYAIKHGSIAGPPDRPGWYEIRAEVIQAVLDAARGGEVGWETDPDFGYDVPARVPGLSEEDGRALLPRLRYADNDRVYEHASLVATKKRERAALLERIGAVDVAVAAATGWPPAPAPADWKE
jgi:hypothetical protein